LEAASDVKFTDGGSEFQMLIMRSAKKFFHMFFEQ